MRNRSGLGCKLQLVHLFIHSLKKGLCQAPGLLTGKGPGRCNLRAGGENQLESSPGTKHCSNNHLPSITWVSAQSSQGRLSEEEAQGQ